MSEQATGIPFRAIVSRTRSHTHGEQLDTRHWLLPGLIGNALIYGTTLFALIFAWPATKHLITRRRVKRGLCTKCKYPRTGLAENAPCPECGTPPAPR